MINPPPAPTYTVREILAWTAQDLAQNGAESPRLDAELLLARALNFSRTELLVNLEALVSPEVLARFHYLSFRRTLREPVAYILGEKPFHEITLLVNRAVLIPRPETEILVEEGLKLLRTMAGRPRVLDLGTGSGAIALALAHSFPSADYLATDVSREALALAAANAERLGLKARVRFRESDRFAALSDEAPWDLIVCNPPYIPTLVLAGLMPEASVYEPRLALDGGEDGLSFIAALLPEAPPHLAPGGYLALEVGDDQAGPVLALAPAALKPAAPIKDLSGMARVVMFQLSI